MAELTHTFTWTLPAPPERVFAALTEPAALRAWFADEVEVEPRPGGAFRFWGDHVYAPRRREDADQVLTRFEPGRALAFTWRLESRDSEVTWDVAPGDPEKNPGGATVTGTHAFAEAPAIGRAKELVDDLWRINEGNLRSWLAGQEVSRVNFADPAAVVRQSIVIEAAVETVFRAFTDPEMLRRWLGAPEPVVEPRAGGRYQYGWKYEVGGRQVTGGPSRILEFEANRRIVTDWPDWRGDPTVPAQKITWLFEDLGGRTRVTLVHDGFVRAVDISDYPYGWGYFLGALAGLFTEAEATA